jgi:hypothetical protein
MSGVGSFSRPRLLFLQPMFYCLMTNMPEEKKRIGAGVGVILEKDGKILLGLRSFVENLFLL